jgi:two-component system chemotaxis response regulator CheB
MIKLLIVEDSQTVLVYLKYIFSRDPDIQVVGTARNGKEAIEFVRKHKVDVVSMDIDMPVMNGLQATKHIMSENPVPIIIVTSSRNAKRDDTSMEALAAGALSVIQKPFGIGHKMEPLRTARMLRMIKTLSKVKVITRKFSDQRPVDKKPIAISNADTNRPNIFQLRNKRYVAIGISSGGPQVLAKIFSKISKNFPYPILVVQHITRGFIGTMVSWLNDILDIPVKVAQDQETLLNGCIYFAPDEHQMGIKANKIELTKCTTESKICPSVQYLFENLTQHYASRTIALILTGMGSDGSAAIKKLKDAGALTIAQDIASSLVHGMPGEAIKLGGIQYVLNTDNITELFKELEQMNLKNNLRNTSTP